MRTLTFAGRELPALGMGTWYMGEKSSRRDDEVAALRAGLDGGLSVVDTAEMYGSGRAEQVVAEAIAGRRDEVFLVDKVLPSHASARGTVQACEQSLRRLGTDHVDLYLLHWRGSHPLAETVQAFARLQEEGKVLAWGVSNLDADDLAELGGVVDLHECATDQVLYNLSRRGPELDPFGAMATVGMPAMAYSPIEQGRLLTGAGRRVLDEVAARHDATATQVALAWTMRSGSVLSIPKAGTVAHQQENLGALQLELDAESLALLDDAFPAPTRPVPLEML